MTLAVPIPVSFPPCGQEFRPELLAIVESVELHLGIPCDRMQLTKTKPLTVDLYLPKRDLFVELDREGHDIQPQRAITLQYYPPGLPRGISLDHYRHLHGAASTQRVQQQQHGATWKMNAGRALADFVKDLYVEGVLGGALVRLPKMELMWLLGKIPENEKQCRLRAYLHDHAARLQLPSLDPCRECS